MARYFYYHVIYVGMINIMLFVPWILEQHRFNGAVSAMAVAIAVGTVLTYVTTSLFLRFPGMGLADILNNLLPRGLAVSLNLIGALVWTLAGILVIYAYSATIQQFFNPDMNAYLFLLLMTVAGVWGASRCTRTVQFAQEILLLISAPLIIMILFKAIFSPWLDWNAIRVTAGYIRTAPSFISFCAATFIFAGYNSLTVFNRLLPNGTKIRFRWIIPLFCSFFLFVSFFIPIGFHGTVGVGEHLYLWSVTADSMILEYGFVYRVLYLFLLLYTALSLMFAMNTWHTAMELIKACHPKHKSQPEQFPVPAANWWITIVFALLTFGYALWTNEQRNQMVNENWLIARTITDVSTPLILGLLVLKGLRKKKSSVSAEASAPDS
ncbi:hypothetical protein [Cohnella cholangitidis]|uniref:Spore germination protein n=1 Tax=Cohnella cholangitidis TaxID=2598458 RepID=A0A7G5C3I7_9BACL|nr:hypothetical protein [Cohnella cholangitidis]QMV43771.1 hypothetical protein FPL14_23305 [Cohnella cholangitidis]